MPEGTKQFLDLEGLRLYDTKIKELIAEHSSSSETIDWDNVANKPEFATVATTGSYDDLTDKPVIPVVPALATVATTGSYEDLVNTPTIPVVPTNVSDFTNDAGYITLNDIPASAVTDIEVSTDGSSYTSVIDENNVAKIDLSDYAATADLATVATSGDYTDLSNKPVIPSNTSDLTNDSGFITLADIPEGPTLATVATTGSYDDLTDKPVIPTVTTATAIADEDTGFTTGDQVYDYVEAHKADAVTITTVKVNGSDLTPDANKAVDITVPALPALAAVATSGDYDDLTNKPAIPTVPTAVSSFTNDAGYITLNEVPADAVAGVEVSTDGSTYSSALDSNNIAKIDLSDYALTSSLGTAAAADTTDFVPVSLTPAQAGAQVNKIENISVNGTQQSISNKTVNLSVITGVKTKTPGDSYYSDVPISNGKAQIDLSIYEKSANLKKVARTGSYEDLTDKPYGEQTIVMDDLGDFKTVINPEEFDGEYWTNPYDSEDVRTVQQFFGYNSEDHYYDAGEVPYDSYITESDEDPTQYDGNEWIWGSANSYGFAFDNPQSASYNGWLTYIQEYSDLANYAVKLKCNGVDYTLPITTGSDYMPGGYDSYYAGQMPIGQAQYLNPPAGMDNNQYAQSLWTHPFFIEFAGDDGTIGSGVISKVVIHTRMTENVVIEDLKFVEIGEPKMIDSQYIPTAQSIAAGDNGYTTGAQVYNAIAGFAGAMHFKGVIAGAASLPNAPEVGDVYIASAAFNFSQEAVEAGDLFVYTNTGWKIIQGNLDVAAIPGLLNQITTNDIDGLFE